MGSEAENPFGNPLYHERNRINYNNTLNIQKKSERINSFAMMETIITHFHEKNTDYIDTEMAELR